MISYRTCKGHSKSVAEDAEHDEGWRRMKDGRKRWGKDEQWNST
jgi:hypothetical protein